MKAVLPTALLFLFATSAAIAEPGVTYRYGPGGKVIGVNAIVDLEPAMTEPGSGCEPRIAELTIDEVVYEGASDMIVGFRAQKPGTQANAWNGLFSMQTKVLYQRLANAGRRDVAQLVRKGANVIVTYQICGSGGFASIRDVYAKAAVNNP